MELTLTDRLGLLWYNYVKRHIDNRRGRRMWIAAGRDPKYFPRAGTISPSALLWARERAEEHRLT